MKKNGNGICNFKPEGKWDQQANRMSNVFAQSGYPSRIPRQECAHPRNIEAKARTKHHPLHSGFRKALRLILRTNHSAKQLSICGAVSIWCKYLPGWVQGPEIHWSEHVQIRRKRKVVTEQLNPQEVASLAKKHAEDKRSRGKLLARTRKTGLRYDDSRTTTSHSM